ncbi:MULTISPECIES: hypothetical protein [unclassified Microcoleus]|uniref:hypothetical protein n=1 Tax=unclassified Microcoleus TaxID=2642155 RepID=UPI002FD09C60
MILDFRFFMTVRGIDIFLTADVGRWTEIKADKLASYRVFGGECDRPLLSKVRSLYTYKS